MPTDGLWIQHVLVRMRGPRSLEQITGPRREGCKEKPGRTFNFEVRALLATANIDEIKRRHGLCEARSKGPNDGLIFDSTARPGGISQTGKVGDVLGRHLNFATKPDPALGFVENGISQRVRGLFPSLNALLYKSFLELGGRQSDWSVSSGRLSIPSANSTADAL